MAPKGIGMRKVRASQGRITDNVRRGEPPGKCNRNRLPMYLKKCRYRWKGEVKAHRHDRQLCANVNPIRCNTVCAEAFCLYLPGISAQVALRSAATQITDRWQSCIQATYRTRLTSLLKKRPVSGRFLMEGRKNSLRSFFRFNRLRGGLHNGGSRSEPPGSDAAPL